MFNKIKGWLKGISNKKQDDKRTIIEKRIDELAERMQHFDSASDEYDKMAATLVTLTEANAKLKESDKKSCLDKNTMFNGIAALVQIIIILMWEERHVIRSEAMKFVTKLIRK